MANLKQVADKIEKRTQQKLARGTVTFELPVYDGQYAARFGVLGEDEIQVFIDAQEAMASATEGNVRKGIEAAGEFIGDACRVILGRGDAGGEFEALTHDDGRPVLFDVEFIEALGLEPAPGFEMKSKADAVVACWTVQDPDGRREVSSLELVNFAEKVALWMQDTRRPVDGEVVEGRLGGLK